MNKKIVPIFAAIICVLTTAEAQVPQWWGFHNPSGKYEITRDEKVTRGKIPGVGIRPTDGQTFQEGKGRFGILYQTINAEKYRGKRVRYSIYVKYEDVNEAFADVWMRVDKKRENSNWYDSPKGNPLSFDAVDLRGNSDWKKLEIVLDVPMKAEAITFGYSLYGNKAIWANGITFETVGKEVPVTDHINPALDAPVNLF